MNYKKKEKPQKKMKTLTTNKQIILNETKPTHPINSSGSELFQKKLKQKRPTTLIRIQHYQQLKRDPVLRETGTYQPSILVWYWMVLPRNWGKLRSDKPKLVSHEISHYISPFWLVNAHEIFSISISYSGCVYANISYEIPVIVGLYRPFLLVKSPTDSIKVWS